jgi:hypothetical protein
MGFHAITGHEQKPPLRRKMPKVIMFLGVFEYKRKTFCFPGKIFHKETAKASATDNTKFHRSNLDFVRFVQSVASIWLWPKASSCLGGWCVPPR